MWRGQLALGLRSFQLTMAATDTPNVDVTTERMTVGGWGLVASPACVPASLGLATCRQLPGPQRAA